MRGWAVAPVALVVGTTEIPDFQVFLIERIPQVVAAIGADQQAGKHIFLAIACLTLTGFAALLLNFSQSARETIGSCTSLKTAMFSSALGIRFFSLNDFEKVLKLITSPQYSCIDRIFITVEQFHLCGSRSDTLPGRLIPLLRQ